MNFQTIWEAVQQAVGKNTGTDLTLIKNTVNMVYLDEVMNADEIFPLFWMVGLLDSRRTVDSTNITAVTKADPGMVTAAGHGLVSGDIFTIYIPSGMTELNARTFKSGSNSTANALELTDPETGASVSTASYTTYTSGGKVVHRGITLSTNIDSFLDMTFDDENNDGIQDITFKELKESTVWWSDQTSRPKRWMHRKAFENDGSEHDQLWWFPGADATYYIRQWVQKQATRLSVAADTPLLPVKFHDILVSGAVTRLTESNVQVENAVVWPSIYTAQIEALIAYNRRYWKRYEKNREKVEFF